MARIFLTALTALAALFGVTAAAAAPDRPPPEIHAGSADPTLMTVALHPAGSTGAVFAAELPFDDWATRDGVLVVYPNGTPVPGRPGLHWNAGRGFPAVGDDAGYLADLIARLRVEWPSVERVTVYGQSQGAVMVYRLLCEHPGASDAAALRSGSIAVDDCDRVPPTLHWHGAEDTVVPRDGGFRFWPLWRVKRVPEVHLRVFPDAEHRGPFPGWEWVAWRWMRNG
jgi:poly(3-hydroxybutyrate) depolymerase